MTQRTPGETKPLTGYTVLIIILAFFGVIIATNAVFLWYALSTHTGVISQQPYRKGLDYNARIAEADAQKNLGWRTELRFDPETRKLLLSIADKYGRPVGGLKVTGVIGRPSTQAYDETIALGESDIGKYQTQLETHSDGTWVVNLEASRLLSDGEQVVYRLRKRLWVKPQV